MSWHWTKRIKLKMKTLNLWQISEYIKRIILQTY
jgi:hypothetical protein